MRIRNKEEINSKMASSTKEPRIYKVVVIGEGGVGKSGIIFNLTHKTRDIRKYLSCLYMISCVNYKSCFGTVVLLFFLRFISIFVVIFKASDILFESVSLINKFSLFSSFILLRNLLILANEKTFAPRLFSSFKI